MNIGDLHNHQMFGMGLFKVSVYCHHGQNTMVAHPNY